MGFFILGWVLIGVGITGFLAGQLFMAAKRKRIKEELKKMQEEGSYEVSELSFSGRK